MHVLVDHVVLGDVGDAALAEPLDHALDEPLGRRGPGRDADRAGVGQPALVDVRLVVDQVGGNALVPGHVDEALRVRRVGRADHEHQIDLSRQRLHRELAVGRGVADVVLGRPDDCREPLAQAGDDRVGLVDRERGLGHVGDTLGVDRRERRDIVDALDERDRVGRLALRTDDLLVRSVADEEDRVAALREAASLLVHLRDERTRRVDGAEAAFGSVQVDLGRNAVRGEDADRALGHVLLRLHEDGAPLLEAPNDVDVVHDLLAHVDGRTMLLEQALDRVDRTFHPRAVPAGAGEQQSAGRDPVVCHRAEG